MRAPRRAQGIGEAARFLGRKGGQLLPVGHLYKRPPSVRALLGDPDHHLARCGRWSRLANEFD